MKYSAYPKEKTEKEKIGAGRHFKLDIKNRFLMLLSAHDCLYITYTLAGFLFDSDSKKCLQRHTKD